MKVKTSESIKRNRELDLADIFADLTLDDF
jgi:hypothetical protein